MSEPKKTPFYEKHIELGGKMVDFEGWLMPVQYQSVNEEHLNCRKNSAVFDISHMGEFKLFGPDSLNFLNYMVTNDVSTLKIGGAQYACLCYPNGTVVDDLFYYKISDTEYKIIVNASNIEKDYDWFQKNKGSFKITLINESPLRGRLAIQGPKTQEILNPITSADLSKVKRFGFIETKLADKPVFMGRTGYTGEDGFEITFSLDDAFAVWDAIFKAGKEKGFAAAGLGARDTLRLEAAYSLYGHEINNEITPIEASIGWAVKNKECEFIGKEVLIKQKSEGTKRILKGIELEEKGVIRRGYKVFNAKDEEIGSITSGAFSPTLNKTIALALIEKSQSEIGNTIKVEIRNKLKNGKIVKTPWVSYRG